MLGVETFHELRCLPARRTVADGDGFDVVVIDHLFHMQFGLHPVIDGRVGEDGLVMEQIALRVEANHFATRAESGVNAHHPFLSQRCGQKQLPQILRKHQDGFLIGLFLANSSKLGLN